MQNHTATSERMSSNIGSKDCATGVLHGYFDALVKPHERHRVSDVFCVNLEDKVNVLNSHSKKESKNNGCASCPIGVQCQICHRCVRQFISHELQTASGSSASSPSSWPLLKPFTSQAVESQNDALGLMENSKACGDTSGDCSLGGVERKIGAAE